MHRPTYTFAEVWEIADGIPGWLTRAQAQALWDRAACLPPGSVVLEIGSHQGRSAVVLAAALPEGSRLVAVDPFGAGWKYGQSDTEQQFRNNLERAGVTGDVEVQVATSAQVLDSWHEPLALVYVDGKHDYWSVLHDLGWSRHLPAGGHLLVHDSFSSIGVTLGVLRHGWGRGASLRYRGRTGSLADFEAGPVSLRDRLALLTPLPWWCRNVAVKVLLRLRLRRAAAGLFGHTDSADPF
ncbi:class I SAM-dependent methyltransferase [Nocardioides houyundeii]|uniref:class I SAM-dependent methyltransferase n=1 Tax=Nocardioides houyundeii TaxID=2045452 RepID=UPI0018EF9244|nr:class I SAM-dependent methyltransferase [Nocardioides houyundeii]